MLIAYSIISIRFSVGSTLYNPGYKQLLAVTCPVAIARWFEMRDNSCSFITAQQQ